MAERWKAAGAAVILAFSGSGCVVGPNFQKPSEPYVDAYVDHQISTTTSSAAESGGGAQRFSNGADIPGDWWRLFHSRQLDTMIELALANNHDLKAAKAALQVARENVLAQRGVYYPNLSAGFLASRQSQSIALAPTPNNNAFQYSLYTPQVSVSYSLDVFGLNRRGTESIKAQEQSVRFEMVAAHLTLTSNVAAAVIQAAAVQSQIEATRQLIDVNTKIVAILRLQKERGYAGQLDLSAQEAQLAQVAATLTPLLKQAAQQHDLIAVLTGRFPSQLPSQVLNLSSLTLPTDLPLSLPSALVEQRPDVLQALANMHAASAQIGVATANRLPNIQLTASAGTTALGIGQVFQASNGFWNLGAELAAPIFDGGTLRHQETAAKNAYVQAAEQYRSTVLGAFQNVADTLSALQQDAEGLNAAAKADAAAKVSLDISERRWRIGYASYLTLLNAEQTYQQARIALVQAEAARYADTAALFQALGGGWWRRADLATDKYAN